MLRTLLKLITLPVRIPVKIVARLLRPKRVARRLLKKRNLMAVGVAAAAVAHHSSQR